MGWPTVWIQSCLQSSLQPVQKKFIPPAGVEFQPTVARRCSHRQNDAWQLAHGSRTAVEVSATATTVTAAPLNSPAHVQGPTEVAPPPRSARLSSPFSSNWAWGSSAAKGREDSTRLEASRSDRQGGVRRARGPGGEGRAGHAGGRGHACAVAARPARGAALPA